MARRTELADVADGMTGHVLWSVGATGFPYEDRLGSTYTFDLIAGTADPTSRLLERLAREQCSDLGRHLVARSIPRSWVASATLTVEFGERTVHNQSLAVCRVGVVDDTGRTHTSTRRGGVWHPVRHGLYPGRRGLFSVVRQVLSRRTPAQ